MTPEFAYLLKVNVAFVLFYAFYRLFFYKDTFFKLRRAILLAFFGLALFYPLLNIQDWVRQQEPIADVIYMYSAMLPEATAKCAVKKGGLHGEKEKFTRCQNEYFPRLRSGSRSSVNVLKRKPQQHR